MNEIDITREGTPTFAEVTEQFYPYPSFIQELEREVAQIVRLSQQQRLDVREEYARYGL